MICFISVDRKSTVSLRGNLLKNNIFAYHKGFPNIDNAHGIKDFINDLPEKPRIAIIDSVSIANFGDDVCNVLKSSYPDTVCIVLYNRENNEFEKFKYYANADYEINVGNQYEPASSLLPLLKKLGYCVNHELLHLKLGEDRKSCLFLGYPFKLSEAEYRILLYMCSHCDKIVSGTDLLCFCFAESYRMVLTNVRTHISSINKKSREIGGRNLILSKRGEGYTLNRYM